MSLRLNQGCQTEGGEPEQVQPGPNGGSLITPIFNKHKYNRTRARSDQPAHKDTDMKVQNKHARERRDFPDATTHINTQTRTLARARTQTAARQASGFARMTKRRPNFQLPSFPTERIQVIPSIPSPQSPQSPRGPVPTAKHTGVRFVAE